MTPEQQALYDKLLEESNLTTERGFGNLYQSTGLLGQQRPPPSPAPSPAPAVPSGERDPESVLAWIRQRAAGMPGATEAAAPPAPRPPPPSSRMDAYAAARAPGPYGSGSPPPNMPAAAPLPPAVARRPLPLDSMGPPPLTPADRPEVAAMYARGETPPPASVDVRRSPPVAQGAGGGPIVERGGFAGRGSDIGIIADIFPGFFKNISKRRNEERAQQSEHNSRMAQLAYEAEQRRALAGEEREAKAPGEARAAQEFSWEREDRDRERSGREAASAAEREKMDPASPASERRRAAFRAANPQLAVWMDRNDPGALGKVAAGDQPTWNMIEERAKQFKRGPGTGGGLPGAGSASGAQESQALLLLAEGDIKGALGIADTLGGKAGQRIRDRASQVAASGARTDAHTEAKRAEAERRSGMPGWVRSPDAPEISAPEAAKLRDGVAALKALGGIASRMKELDASMSTADRLKAKMGLDTAQTAEAMQLQRLTTTKIRQIANMGVPSLAEMAIANQQAPELSSASAFLNGTQRFDALVRAMDIETNAQMGARGYSREGAGGGEKPRGDQYAEGQTATGPGGKKLVFKGGKWVPL